MPEENAFSKLPVRLREILGNLPKIALAFSGGVDSRFLAHAARICGSKVLAINASGPHIPLSDSVYAKAHAKKTGLELDSFHFDPLDFPEVRHNSRERCYGCKLALLTRIATRAASRKDKSWILCDGGNADDQDQFRPGLKAVREAGVFSPLAEAGLTKADIRRLAKETGMANPDQPSRACLLTRFNYGLTIDRIDLERLEQCERAIAGLFAFYDHEDWDFRLRIAPKLILQVNGDAIPYERALNLIAREFEFGPLEILVCSEVSGFFDSPAPVFLE